MLGCREETEQEPDKLIGDADVEAEPLAPGYPCPVCKKGRMVSGKETPRPTVRQIMAMPFPGEAYVEKQRKRLRPKPRRKRAQGWRLVEPAGQLRQWLLPFGFT